MVYKRLRSEVKCRCLFTSVKLCLFSSFTKNINNWNSEKVYLVVCRYLLVVCSHMLVVCGRLLMVCGRLLVVCGRLWSFAGGL